MSDCARSFTNVVQNVSGVVVREDPELLGADRVEHLGRDLVGRHALVDERLEQRREHRLAGGVLGVDSPSGRLRALSAIRVRTQPGHSTDTFTCGAIIAISWCSVSDSATTACLLALYGPMNGPATRPAIDAVFTTCPSSCCMRIGTNARMPWITPQRLTPSTHSHVESGASHDSPPAPTPALLHAMWIAPKRSTAASAERLHLRRVADVGAHADHLGARRLELRDRVVERGLLDVAEHDLHALGRERRREREPDAARAAR